MSIFFWLIRAVRCTMPINRASCSSDSICIDLVNSRPICVCPLTKFGARCLLTSACPINHCQNNGQCIRTVSTSNSTRICLNRFFGGHCPYWKSQVDLSFEGLDLSPYHMAFFFYYFWTIEVKMHNYSSKVDSCSTYDDISYLSFLLFSSILIKWKVLSQCHSTTFENSYFHVDKFELRMFSYRTDL